MDRKYIDMYLLIDRYLLGTLTEREKVGFEERLIWDHELIDEIHLAERLQGGLQESIAQDRYGADCKERGIARRLAGLFSRPQYAAAASFLLAATLVTGVFQSPYTSNYEFSANSHTEIVPLIVVRGPDVQTIVVNNRAWTVLLVDVMESYEAFRVIVRKDDSSAETVWRQVGLSPTYLGSLAVGIPGNVLTAGHYVLTLEGMRDSGVNTKNTYEHLQHIRFQTVAAE